MYCFQLMPLSLHCSQSINRSYIRYSDLSYVICKNFKHLIFLNIIARRHAEDITGCRSVYTDYHCRSCSNYCRRWNEASNVDRPVVFYGVDQACYQCHQILATGKIRIIWRMNGLGRRTHLTTTAGLAQPQAAIHRRLEHTQYIASKCSASNQYNLSKDLVTNSRTFLLGFHRWSSFHYSITLRCLDNGWLEWSYRGTCWPIEVLFTIVQEF